MEKVPKNQSMDESLRNAENTQTVPVVPPTQIENDTPVFEFLSPSQNTCPQDPDGDWLQQVTPTIDIPDEIVKDKEKLNKLSERIRRSLCCFCQRQFSRPYDLRNHYTICSILAKLLKEHPERVPDKIKSDIVIFQEKKRRRKAKRKEFNEGRVDFEESPSECWNSAIQRMNTDSSDDACSDDFLSPSEDENSIQRMYSGSSDNVCSDDFLSPSEDENLYNYYINSESTRKLSSSSCYSTSSSSDDEQNEQEGFGVENESAIKRVLEQAERYLQIEEEHRRFQHVYTRRTSTPEQVVEAAKSIMYAQKYTFKIQIQIGYLLKDLENGEYTLFYAEDNTGLFDTAVIVSRRKQIKEVLQTIHDYDWTGLFNFVKSGLTVVRLVYTRFVIVSTGDRPLKGKLCKYDYSTLPEWIKKNRYIISKHINPQQTECDSLCVFRSLANYFVHTKNVTHGRTPGVIQKLLFSKYIRLVRKRKLDSAKPKDFDGVFMDEIPKIEKILNVPINIYSFQYSEDCDKQLHPKNLKAVPLYFSKLDSDSTTNQPCNLLRHMNHLMFITQLDKALGVLTCPMCDARQFYNHYTRHVKMCSNRIKKVRDLGPQSLYHSGKKYSPPKEIIEDIEQDLGHALDYNLKNVHFLATFDIETYFETFNELVPRGKQTFSESKLHVFVIGVCSNVPGFETSKFFWLDELGSNLIKDFIDYLLEISAVQYQILIQQFEPVFQTLKAKLYCAQLNGNNYGAKKYSSLIQRLDEFLSRLPIIGYNSGRFDLKVMRETFLIELYERYKNDIKIQSRDGRYTRVICGKSLLFLDQMNFLSAKQTYDAWIFKTLSVKCKGKMPYSIIDSLDKLNYPGLPPYEEWFSSLRNHNILDSDYDSYRSYLGEGFSEKQALSALGLSQVPKPGPLLLEELREEFRVRGFTTFKDYVRLYLDGDITPMVKACTKTSRSFYDSFGINLYRCYVSIPAVAIKQAFGYLENEQIFIPSEENYKEFQKTPGGQSLLIQLEAIKNVTPIRQMEFGENSLVCQSIFSLDSSLHYGKSMEDMPVTGPERVRLPENGFIPKFTDPRFLHYFEAERILAYIMWKRGINIKSYVNGGEDICGLGKYKYRPDGVSFDGRKTRLFEIYEHASHFCPYHPKPLDELHSFKRNKATGEKMKWGEIKSADETRIEILKREYNVNKVKIVYRCQFQSDYIEENGAYHGDYLDFLTDHPEYNPEKQKLTESEILNEIRQGRMNGFIVADFTCPAWLRSKTELFPLIFKKATIERKDAGVIMEKILEKLDLLRKPSTELISSHFGVGLLASTSLVRFYMEMGVEISRIQRVIEYNETVGLKKMVAKCCDLRFKASKADNEQEKILGDLSKQLCVSTYGKFLTSPKKFTRIQLVPESKLINILFCEPFISVEFCGVLPSTQECLYEIKKRPRVLHYTSPIQMGSAVLFNAKLHILRLVYDVIKPCFDPRSYTFFASMTDSLSIVCSEESFEKWVEKQIKPEMREKFDKVRDQYFVIPGDSEVAQRSKFKAGIFKQEWIGTIAVGLGPKTYMVGRNDKVVKIAARSVPVQCFSKLNLKQFLSVLHEHQPITVKFSGFSYVCGEILLEQMYKTAVKAYYVKRQLLPDCSTRTLDL